MGDVASSTCHDTSGMTTFPGRPAARNTATIIATAGLVLLTAACGGPSGGHVAQLGSTTAQSRSSSNPPAASPSQENEALAFSRCMRSNGVPRFPDASASNAMPDGLPKVSSQELGVSSSQFQAAESACRKLLPDGVETTQGASQHILSTLVSFARCMRSHEVENWPDPVAVSAQAPPGAPPYTFDLHGLQGLDQRSFSAQINTAMNECFRLTHLTDAQVPWSG